MLLKIVVLGLACQLTASLPLEQYNVDPSTITVSGISSGACMATQMHVIYSNYISGMGSVAGVTYWCSEGGTLTSLNCMSTPSAHSAAMSYTKAESMSSQGRINAVSNLNNDKVYIYHGTVDSVVDRGNRNNMKDFYQHFGSSIFMKENIVSEHGYINTIYGSACSSKNTVDYMNDCNFYLAQDMMSHFYGGIQTTSQVGSISSMPGDFYEFDTREFFLSSTPLSWSMSVSAFIYVPSACVSRSTVCKLHVALHGCAMQYNGIGNVFIEKSGYLEIGEANNIIMIFPQTVVTASNPQACWDWWGYTNALQGADTYVSSIAAQPLAILRMIEKAASLPSCPECRSAAI